MPSKIDLTPPPEARRNGESKDKKSDYVVVKLKSLIEDKTSTLQFKFDYWLIQQLKKIRDQKGEEFLTEEERIEVRKNEIELINHEPPTFEENEKALIQKCIDEFRPEMPWSEIAKMLGVAPKTLINKRKKHDFHYDKNRGPNS